MTIEISSSDITTTIIANDTGPLPLLISGSRNSVTVISDFLIATGTGPAIRLTGTDNLLRLYYATVSAASGVAIEGSAGVDQILVVSANVSGSVLLGGGNDYFSTTGAYYNGTAYGGDGDDGLIGIGATNALTFYGENGNDSLSGGSAGDYLDGGADNDSLRGNAGDDTLVGGTGADVLEGGVGNDTLTGGGDEGDVAVFFNYLSDTTVTFNGGAGSLVDNGGSFSDLGTDTFTGIDVVRFRDQLIDFRITRNELVLSTADEAYTNTVGRYGYPAASITASGITLTNQAEIRGTAVEHTVSDGNGGLVNAEAFTLRVAANSVTIQNAVGGSIVGPGYAIGMHYGTGQVFTGLTVANNGLIRSDEASGIYLVTGSVTVTNAAGATISGQRHGIEVPNGNADVTNYGTIATTGSSIWSAVRAGNLHMENYGSIIGGFESLSRFSTVNNSGTITGNSRSSGGLTFNNLAGTVNGNLTIDVTATAGQGEASYTYLNFDNRASFTGDLRITGTATSYVVVPPAGTVYTSAIVNSGTLTGNIVCDQVLGTGPGGAALAFMFRDEVTNSGTISGNVWLGSGNDLLTNSGTISGAVYGQSGDDTLIGGAQADRLYGGDGNDDLQGGGGDDLLVGGGGVDLIAGGSGNDRLEVEAAGSGSTIDGGANLDTLVISGTVTLASIASIEAVELASGSALTLTSSQLMSGLAANTVVTGSGSLVVNLALAANVFMSQMNVAASVAVTVNGSAGNDIYKGPLGASSTASMGDGNDFVRTGQLADIIDGGAGSDKIIGLGGSDTINGGSGADQFRYLFAADSGLGSAADRILDFTNGEDRLDFRLLDANPALAGRQLLSFIGTGAFTASGTAQLRYGDSGSDTVVQIDLDGNGTADMEIMLVGHAGQGLSGTDFMF